MDTDTTPFLYSTSVLLYMRSPMPLIEIALREGNYEMAALFIVYGMLEVTPVAVTLLIVISYK